jgi:heme/copper-type cytochrome/quinol oxidase subunit 2
MRDRLTAISIICLIIMIITLIAVMGVQLLPFQTNTPSSQLEGEANVSPTACVRSSGYILIIADLRGFNGSISHGAPASPWPIIRVDAGKIVKLIVCNLDTTQPHGFAIDHYLPAGVPIRSGEAYKISFVADDSGDFVIYCNIFCTIHVFMRGELIVQ